MLSNKTKRTIIDSTIQRVRQQFQSIRQSQENFCDSAESTLLEPVSAQSQNHSAITEATEAFRRLRNNF